MPDHARQPWLHELVTVVRAPALAISSADGQIRTGVDGLFCADRRWLSSLLLRIDGAVPDAVSASLMSADHGRFVAAARSLGDGGADPTVTVQRDRAVQPSGLVETITLTSFARDAVDTVLELEVGCDLAEMNAVKAGLAAAPLPSRAGDGAICWAQNGVDVELTADPPPAHAVTGGRTTLSWPVRLERGRPVTITIIIQGRSVRPHVVAAATRSLDRLEVRADDRRLTALIEQSLTDLDALCLSDPLAPQDTFLAAGAPWFLTLFGRDAIWAARMLLPLGTELAAGTLRTLARRQGNATDVGRAEEPGKIMHEIRADAADHQDMQLPPLYYGTVDATALWISLLHDAWRWGMPREHVHELLPNLSRAMSWIIDHGTNADGFVAYRDASGHGLANQGWKDSGDSVQFRDGELAEAPIALCEVQGYCFAAAHQAADLADAFGIEGAAGWRSWAAGLADRFRSSFWIDDPAGRYPAIALDAKGRQVDTVTSNIAHLLGTGLLDTREESAVVARLSRPDMDSGYGLRTMSGDSAGYNPLGYHAGSVWTHDTAIAVMNLAASPAAGAQDAAASLLTGLLSAAPAFDHRMPELFGGHPRADYPRPVPYPAACRPQAWAAAASIAMVSSMIGVHPDVPAGVVTLRPMRPAPLGALSVRGIRLAGPQLDIDLDAHGDPVVRGAAGELRVEVL